MFGWLSKRDKGLLEAAEELIAEGIRAEDAGDAARACELYRQAVGLAPQHAKAHLNLGIGLEAMGDDAGARASFESALRCDPANSAAAYNLGRLLYTKKAYADAEHLLKTALGLRPDFPEAHIVRGYVLQSLGRLEEAARELQAGLEKRPEDAAARAALSRVLVEVIPRAAQTDPENPQAHFNLGQLRQAQGELELALACYRKALLLQPSHEAALFSIAGVHAQQGNLQEAIAAYRNLLARQPAHAAALCNLATALKSIGQRAQALEYYRKAIEAAPQFADAHYNLAVALRDQGRIEDAVASFRRSIELRPDIADAHFGLGHALRDSGRKDEAIRCFERALSLDPDHAPARWSHTIAYLPAVPADGEEVRASRQQFAVDLADLERWFEGKRLEQAAIAVGTDQPFELAYQEEDNRPLLERYGALCARLMDHWRQRQGLPLPGAREHRPLRVGIVSAHLRTHSVWSAITRGWFEALDPGRFGLYAFHLSVDEDDETAYARSRAARYERGPKDLRQWVDCIRACEPDVLLYPEVGIDPMTVRLASLRLAPLQAATWGHPETTGLPTIDCYLSAEDLEPQDGPSYYTERLIRLPHLGCRFKRITTTPVEPDLAQAQADGATPLLICPGVPFKYAPQHDWVFPEIARRLGECRFVFFKHRTRLLSEKLERRLQSVFEAQGLAYERFVSFIPWQPVPAFMGWLRRADVYLDTIGFSGFNTALYAVEAGLPIVTREGRFLRGRLGSGILKRLELPELVAPTGEAYVELAVRLAQDKAYRGSITSKMELGRERLYDDPAPVRALEELLGRGPSAR